MVPFHESVSALWHVKWPIWTREKLPFFVKVTLADPAFLRSCTHDFEPMLDSEFRNFRDYPVHFEPIKLNIINCVGGHTQVGMVELNI